MLSSKQVKYFKINIFKNSFISTGNYVKTTFSKTFINFEI